MPTATQLGQMLRVRPVLAFQVKLLRFLGERTFERVGSNNTLTSDVRLIAATNLDLEEEVGKGNFREDLFFRLNVVTIKMPPLRDHAEDIVLLASSFLREFAEENGRPLKPLSDEALNLLRQYSWPGNVRELRTAIEHGVVMSNEEGIELHHLPAFLDQNTLSNPAENADPANVAEKGLAPPREFNLHDLEMHAIRSALRHTSGRSTATGRAGPGEELSTRPPERPDS